MVDGLVATTSVEAKRTKRVRDNQDDISLEDHIACRRKRLVEERERVGELQDRVLEYRREAGRLTQRWQVRQRRDLERRAEELEKEIEVRRSMKREHDFESTVVTYLRMYHSADAPAAKSGGRAKKESITAYVKDSGRAQQHKSIILDEYLSDMNQAPPKVAMATRDECPKCCEKLLVCSSRAIMSCAKCGYCVTYLDATSASTSFDEVVEYSQYSYKRVNHYIMWISLVQGKEAHRVPDDIMQRVMADLYDRQHVRTATDVTMRRVRDSLRHLRLRKAYDHVAQISSRISGLRPPRIPPETEEQLKNMFLQMQPAFQRHAPKTRTNFLSYSYVLYRCFQILGLHHMLEGLSLLKGRDKLEANDVIFRRMSEELGWPIFDLPPASETM